MGTTAQKLQNIIDSKAAISAVIATYGGTVPSEFNQYASAIELLINPPAATSKFYYNDGTSEDIDIVGDVPTQAYMNNSTITKIEFGTHCTGIGLRAFKYASKLSAVTFSSTMTKIDIDGLNSTKLVNVTIPGNIKTVGQGSFRDIKTLQTIEFENGVETLGYSVCYGNTALTSAVLPNTVTTIPIEMFWNCTALQSVNVPTNLTTIERIAFYNCSNCNSLTLPSTVTTIGQNAFQNFGTTSGGTITLEGKTVAEAQVMSDFRWGIGTDKIICTDGTL